eukprot:4382182-Pleurochrysis_carterae.AAC.4
MAKLTNRASAMPGRGAATPSAAGRSSLSAPRSSPASAPQGAKRRVRTQPTAWEQAGATADCVAAILDYYTCVIVNLQTVMFVYFFLVASSAWAHGSTNPAAAQEVGHSSELAMGHVATDVSQQASASAIILPTFISSHMVLQRAPASARVWGNAPPKSTVTAKVKLDATKAGGARTHGMARTHTLAQTRKVDMRAGTRAHEFPPPF